MENSAIVKDGVEQLATFIGCYLAQLFVSPALFVNHIAINVIDLILGIVPSTPENLKIASLANRMATENPIGWYLGGKALQMGIPILSILGGVKAWKIWRPF